MRARGLVDLGAVGVIDAEGGAVEGGVPSGLVHHMMVVVAEQDEVDENGLPAVLPVDDVVGITPSGGSSTPGISTSLVADDQRPPEAGGDGPPVR